VRCLSQNDCPVGNACVGNTCSANNCDTTTLLCHGGCCDTTVTPSACVDGTAAATCGQSGGSCTSCAAQSDNKHCLANGACGCVYPQDCATGEACTANNFTACSTTCDAQHFCHTGCCNGTQCAPGTIDTVCGTGGMCGSCLDTNTLCCNFHGYRCYCTGPP
jgi:hypothetical protein